MVDLICVLKSPSLALVAMASPQKSKSNFEKQKA